MAEGEVNEHKLMREAARAVQAEVLLNNELLKESFAYLEAEYVKAWRNTGVAVEDTNSRERLWQAINLLATVQKQLRRVIEGGKISKKQLEEIERKRDLVSRA